MIGITLSSDQIRTAPPEVRRWIEREVTVSLGLQIAAPAQQDKIEELALCSVEELSSILALIEGVLPAVNVLFELGHEGMRVADGRLQAYRLIDIQHHVRLRTTEQVLSCLDLINDALSRVRGTADAIFDGVDNAGHCFITVQTQENIARLWQQVVAADKAPIGSAMNSLSAPVTGHFQQPPFQNEGGRAAQG